MDDDQVSVSRRQVTVLYAYPDYCVAESGSSSFLHDSGQYNIQSINQSFILNQAKKPIG